MVLQLLHTCQLLNSHQSWRLAVRRVSEALGRGSALLTWAFRASRAWGTCIMLRLFRRSATTLLRKSFPATSGQPTTCLQGLLFTCVCCGFLVLSPVHGTSEKKAAPQCSCKKKVRNLEVDMFHAQVVRNLDVRFLQCFRCN